MSDFIIPGRKYATGSKKMVSWRLPETLMSEIEKMAKKKGWTVTDLVTTVLDQFIQQEEESKNAEPNKKK